MSATDAVSLFSRLAAIRATLRAAHDEIGGLRQIQQTQQGENDLSHQIGEGAQLLDHAEDMLILNAAEHHDLPLPDYERGEPSVALIDQAMDRQRKRLFQVGGIIGVALKQARRVDEGDSDLWCVLEAAYQMLDDIAGKLESSEALTATEALWAPYTCYSQATMS
jgi:hypothetical protein